MIKKNICNLKIKLLIILLLTISSSLFSKSKEKYLISQILININDEITAIDLTNDKILTDNELSKTVLTFTNFRIGKVYTLKGIESELLQTKTRLIYSKYFYYIDILSKEDLTVEKENIGNYNGYRTIEINLKNKTLHRFTPGLYWLQYGLDGIQGQKQGFRVTAGWNKFEAEYFHHNFANQNVYLSFLANYSNLFPQIYNQEDGNSNIKFSAGYYFLPDLLVASTFRLQRFYSEDFTIYSDYDDTGFSITPFFVFKRQFLKLNQSSGKAKAEFSYYPFITEFSTNGTLTANFNLLTYLQFAVLLSGGYATPDIPLYGTFDLYSTEDRNIRSGYTKEELTALSFFLASIELRFDFLNSLLPRNQSMTLQGFLFTDFSEIIPFDKTLLVTQDTFNQAEAFGAGLRIKLNHPLLIFLSFSYGLNINGSGRFVFTATAGY